VKGVTSSIILLGVIHALETIPPTEAIMPSRIIGTMVVLGLLLGVNASGHAAPFEQPEVEASDILINRPEPVVSEEDRQAANRERFRTLFFNERGQLR
jgi:hypothetical protein